ncbi:methyl-accepting chemotaxis protein [Butyrivibrio sp. NC3005]|uniref:methyl-accepting chemotaxis protein n=1 Tax=Butyrivibrio sp. NC3005 TaxID=1280685 RepID=UPI0009DC3FF9|nr:methyl-accepting chemotaxis protein [Butyrivibrio sp. NC3005]
MKEILQKFSIKNLKIGFKILLLVFLGVFGMILIGSSGYRSLKRASADIDNMYNRKLSAIRLLGNEVNYMRMIQVRIVKHILDPQDEEINKSIDAAITSFDETWPQYSKLANLVPEVAAKLPKTESDWDTFKKGIYASRKLADENKQDEAWTYYKSVEAGITQELLHDLTELQQMADDNASILNKEIKETNKKESMFILLCIAACLTTLITLSFFIVRAITKSLKEMMYNIDSMKEGDFRITENTNTRGDEFGHVANAIYDMKKSLNTLMRDVNSSAEQLAASSEELSASSDQSAQTSNMVAESTQGVIDSVMQQHNAVGESSKSVETMQSSVNMIKKQSDTVANNSKAAANHALKGNEAIIESVNQIKLVEEIVENTSKLVNKLGQRSIEIGEIVDAITSISAETNLLALNAAIEASHAGEYGKGFNVVADEVRNLANESANSAKQIAEIISAIQEDTRLVVESMNEGKDAVIKGSEKVQNLTHVFGDITKLVNDVSIEISEVSTSINLMADNMNTIEESVSSIQDYGNNVSTEMQNVSVATQQQSATAQELAAASESLASLAQEQQIALSNFQF